MTTIAELIDLSQAYLHDLPPAAPTPPVPQGEEIASFIDHTLLKPEATAEQVKIICQEARQHAFAAVCVNPSFVPLVHGLLKGTKILVCAVAGFPLGASLPSIKAFETLTLLEHGANEIDMVINIGALKDGAYGLVLNDIAGVVQTAHNQQAQVKVIIETGLLSQQEKILACLLSKAAGADFVKTSTGFSTGGATVEDIDLMHRIVGPQVKVKASGGVRNLADALAMIQAGASRIGTSSGIKILQEATS